jgi:hypothetical protein
MSAAQLRKLTHTFPEYCKNEPVGNTSKEISLADMLEALGQSDRLKKIEEDAEEVRSAHRLLSEYPK